jgi:threonine 3-dehydrogenase
MVMDGKIATLAIPALTTPIDWNCVIVKALTIKGIYGREMFETWYKMLAMLQSGLDVRKVITYRMNAAGYAAGFDLMKQGSCGKVVLDWG